MKAPQTGLRIRFWFQIALSGCLGAVIVLALHRQPNKKWAGNVSPSPPAMLVPVSLAGVIDDRARFREIFCALDAEHGAQFPIRRSCEAALQQLDGESAPSGRAIPAARPRDRVPLHIVIIPGMFGQCVKRWAAPLQDAAEYMDRQGYRVDTIDVDARSSSAKNADTIAIALPHVLGSRERLLIIGYSKGMSDILETLVIHPQAIPAGSAIVSLAGIVSGTPLADHPEELDRVVSRLPLPNCGPGDAGAVESLSPRHRLAWLADHPLPRDRTYFSVVAFAGEAQISRPLEETHRQLSWVDGHNDGQVLSTDAVVPGSHLLGYLNADHWAVALPLARNVPQLRPLFAGRNDYPREILLEAIVRSVEEQLDSSTAARAAVISSPGAVRRP